MEAIILVVKVFETMQIAVAIALTVIYVGLSLAFGGARPANGFPWWFFAPCLVIFCAGLIAKGITAILPTPWADGRPYGPPPRRVHLSWRAAVRLPVYAVIPIIPWHMLTIMRMHFDLDWVALLLAALALVILALEARRRWREIRLLRDGEVIMASVDSRENTQEEMDRIYYHFITARGIVVSGRAFYYGYDVREGSSVPVFYYADNPEEHVAACACWFETD